MKITDLALNQSYTNADLSAVFQCGNMGGMRRSLKTNSLVLISKHGSCYQDNWKDGVLHYTGMGKVGNQSFDFARNKTLAESDTNGVEVYLFESFEPNSYLYRGRVCLAGQPYYDYEKGDDDYERQVVKFPLQLVN